MIHDVGRWTLATALKEYVHWLDLGLEAVPIAVNVSPLQLRNRQFTEMVVKTVRDDQRAAGGLDLEITESVAMENVEYSIASLLAIRVCGVCVAIDDFGTGFSSLSQLSRLPIDALKIDRAFVRDMANGGSGIALVSAIVELAHAMKLKVIAEGVETDSQLQTLRRLQCDEVQGYFFSRPITASEFQKRFLGKKAD